jgi:hypothetical protein
MQRIAIRPLPARAAGERDSLVRSIPSRNQTPATLGAGDLVFHFSFQEVAAFKVAGRA